MRKKARVVDWSAGGDGVWVVDWSVGGYLKRNHMRILCVGSTSRSLRQQRESRERAVRKS